MTPDGAELWYESIRDEVEAEVFYYLTTYKQGTWFGDWCSLVTNLVLKWPNDGATSVARGKLPLGSFQGVTQKQCHTADMKYLGQYLDKARNAAMDSYTDML